MNYEELNGKGTGLACRERLVCFRRRSFSIGTTTNKVSARGRKPDGTKSLSIVTSREISQYCGKKNIGFIVLFQVNYMTGQSLLTLFLYFTFYFILNRSGIDIC